MMGKITNWVTSVVTGDEEITKWVMIGFAIFCLLVSIIIMFMTAGKTASIAIGPSEEQLLLSEL